MMNVKIAGALRREMRISELAFVGVDRLCSNHPCLREDEPKGKDKLAFVVERDPGSEALAHSFQA